jgi:starvation-inducible DNA-binding protein
MEPTPNTLSENTGARSVKLLNKNLAGMMDLYALSTQPHWNVRRRGLIAIHDLENYRDLIVARVDPLSGVVARLHRFVGSGTLAAFGQSLREAIGLVTSSGEVDTADLIFQDLAGRRPATLFPRLSLYV